MQERLKSKTEGKTRVLANETKAAIKDKVEGIEKLSEEDFDGLLIMMKSLRLTLLEESKDVYKCPKCGAITVVSLNFAAIVDLLSRSRR